MEKQIIRKEVLYIEFKLFEGEGKNRSISDDLREEFLQDKVFGHVNFWIDLSELSCIGSSLIGVIAFMHNSVKENGKIVISGVSKKFKEIFDIVGFEHFKNIEFILR